MYGKRQEPSLALAGSVLVVRLVLCVLTFVLFSGCSDGKNGDESVEDDSNSHPPVASFDLAMQVTGCREITAIIPVSFAHAGQFLPVGFAPADLSVMLGTPVDVGQSAVVLSNAICDGSDYDPAGYSEGLMAVLIQPPALEGDAAAPYNLYEVAMVTRDGPLGDLIATVGWNVIGDSVESSIGMLPLGAGSGAIGDANGTLYSVASTAPAAGPTLSGVYRWFQVLPGGLAFFDYEFAAQAYLGVPSCEIRAESIAAELAGRTDCSAANTVLATAVFDAATVTFSYRAGVVLG